MLSDKKQFLIAGLLLGPLFLWPLYAVAEWYDDTTKFYWFVFNSDFGQRLKWYVFDTFIHVESVCYAWAAYLGLKNRVKKGIELTVRVLLFLAIFRLVEYWLFRWFIDIETLLVAVILFSLGTIAASKKEK